MKIKIMLTCLAAVLFLSFTNKNKKFKTPEKFVFIPSGSTSTDDIDYSCQAFFMLEHEVTNFEYRSFLNDLKKSGKMDDYRKAYPDSTKWLDFGGYMQPMAQHYFIHPAYDNYPVVNVSEEGVNLFCEYLTAFYRIKYGETINDVRLPTKLEWIYAAKGGKERSVYPWGGRDTRNKKGCYMANYKTIGDAAITKDADGNTCVKDGYSSFEDGALTIAPTDSYQRNDYGLYNMSGNVAELVSDASVAMGGHWNSTGYDIRVESEEIFEESNPFVGFRPVMSFLIINN